MVSKVETNPIFSDWSALEQLLRTAYAPMENRIAPPSSLATMTTLDIVEKCRSEDLFLARENGIPIACGFGKPNGSDYEIGKVAVSDTHRGQGYARAIMDAATLRAKALDLDALMLFARVELTENHATYTALGFKVVGDFTHPGFDQPTALRFRRAV